MSIQGLFPVFPQEIIIEFVKNLIGSDHITWNERKSLLSCCLTSRAFSAAARRHFWSTVSLSSYKAGPPDQNISRQLSIHEFSQDIQRLKELLGSPTSDLSQLVRSLIISLDPTHYLVKELEELLTIIASRASNLKQLRLERTPWDIIPPGTFQSFIKVVRVPSLSTIDLSLMVNVPEDVVKNSTALRSLHLSTVEFAKPDSHLALPLNEFLHDTAEYGFADCDRSVTGTYILHIESITMRLLSSDAPKFGRLVGTVSRSLTSLDLSFLVGKVNIDLRNAVPLGSLSSLRTILLRFHCYAGLNFPPAQSITRLFNHTQPTALRKIEIIFRTSMLYQEALLKFIPQIDENKLGY